MTEEEISNFEKIQAQTQSFHDEMSALARKTPNAAINKFKIKFINKALAECNDILGPGYSPFEDFDLFDEDELPSSSDVAMMLGQYLSCLEKKRADNIYVRSGYYYWTGTEIRTLMPEKINRKK
ncbi:hypothetical protein GO495_22955 [Chitinophaga oryziterrae]|uniref:Uncharacterized protein n=1 Tax=Chitinophaga oryziterrae TaxID=1031224 RepID=A0A6N8JDX5_9BACT|nr:hypothetical protein [Chitinophaga oryziterrae]MVT43477.1 hypothetical protein [Chitinophaga oryziterrae]